MNRLMTSTCLAAAFAVGLAAQSTSTTQDPPAGQRGGPRPVTATGCLRTGDTAGTYMLTDVQLQGGGRRTGDTTGTTAGGGTTTTGTSTTAGGGATGQAGRAQTPTTLMLNPAADVDLKPHVGHKIEVTGTMMGGRGGAGTGTTTTASGTGGTTGTTTSGTAGRGTTTGTGTSASGGGGTQGGRAMRNVTVTSIRMISESCS